MASQAARKAIHLQKLHNHLKHNNTHLVIVSADNLRVSQIQAIRQGLRPHSSVVMGKNSFMRRSLEIHAPSAGKPAFVGAVPHINGKVGLILTDCDPEEVSEMVAGYKLQPLVEDKFQNNKEIDKLFMCILIFKSLQLSKLYYNSVDTVFK
ncbi:60S acidic ribosomal protein P0-1-like [Helianthus annuus]|uniref:60S acidic ribosomal protein P0-1-like n=1 Tax=Helianthus annuus TaxID=4232 RepID=UPI001652BC12|nr:60S acidic ribosomal protein P0-1-like [Helianthus annuus]